LNSFESLERAVEYFCFYPEKMHLAGQAGRPKRRKQQLIRRFSPEVRIYQGNPGHVCCFSYDRVKKKN